MKTVIILILTTAACAGDLRTDAASQSVCVMGTECCPGSPILIDMAGDGLHLSAAEDGVRFQLHQGRVGQWAWTLPGSDDAFLVVDLNDNGIIDDGSEMFGDSSMQVTSSDPNGFAALAYYDLVEHGGNGDKWIDERDEIWPKLQLWRDVDHDGVSSPTELVSLAQAGVHALSPKATKISVFDAYGNESRFVAPIVAEPPIAPVASDIWLTQAPINHADGCINTFVCFGWTYALSSSVDPSKGINGPCSLSGVSSKPLVSANGFVYRYISAGENGGSESAVQTAVLQDLISAMQDSTGYCLFGPILSPDPNDKNNTGIVATSTQAPFGSFSYKISCTTEQQCTSGGGCNG